MVDQFEHLLEESEALFPGTLRKQFTFTAFFHLFLVRDDEVNTGTFDPFHGRVPQLSETLFHI